MTMNVPVVDLNQNTILSRNVSKPTFGGKSGNLVTFDQVNEHSE